MYINHKMFKKPIYLLSKIFLILFLSITNIFADIVNNIVIKGNDRIADETIKMFSKVEIGEKLNENQINVLLKNLYETNFFRDVSITEKNVLLISVKENPLI